MTTKHTPTPWHQSDIRGHENIIYAEDGYAVCDTRVYHNKHDYMADAAFIVRACNSHDELVSDLRLLVTDLKLGVIPSDNALEMCERLLNKIEGEQL